jgi:hypothetical protein
MGRKAAMTTPGKLVTLAALVIATASSGCLYQREAVREPPPPVVQNAPPPPPQVDPNAQPPPADDDSAAAFAEDQGVPPPGADVTDDRVFYERLAPYGHWEWVPEYGRVWVPAVAPGWRPYVYGRWVLTDWGWTWVSDDPWAWAAYHYGSWGFTVGIGWFWVPGHVWAPAWVTWRWGFGYCAWAPIGPRGFYYGYTHPAWVAVPAAHFTEPISVHVVAVQRTPIIVQRTSPLPAPRAAPARGGAFGPPVAQVTAATGRSVRAMNARVVIAPRTVTTATVRPASTASPVRAQSPMQSPRVQPQASSSSSWRGAARQGVAAGSWRTRVSANTPGAARPSAGARASGGVPTRSGGAGGAPRAAPSAPRSGGGGGGGARASGGGHGGGGGRR